MRTVVAVRTDSGSTKELGLPAPFGTLAGSGGQDLQADVLRRTGLTGHRIDLETGWSAARARHIDNATGLFIPEDPYGIDAGPSLYVYAIADPVNYVDRTGELFSIVIPGAIAAVATAADIVYNGRPAGTQPLDAAAEVLLNASEAAVLGRITAGTFSGFWNGLAQTNGRFVRGTLGITGSGFVGAAITCAYRQLTTSASRDCECSDNALPLVLRNGLGAIPGGVGNGITAGAASYDLYTNRSGQ